MPDASGSSRASPSTFGFMTSKSANRKGPGVSYGIHDLARNVGWVSVGVDHDAAAFAVDSICRWWRWMGRPSYPEAKRLLITADSGGSKSRAGATLEMGTATASRRNRTRNFGLSFS